MAKISEQDRQKAEALFSGWDLQRGYDDLDWQDRLGEVIPELAQALADLRERCAALADSWANSQSCSAHDDNPCCHVRTAYSIAEAIRQGGGP